MIGEAWMSNVKFCSIIFHLKFFLKPFRLISIFSSSLPLPPIFFYFFRRCLFASYIECVTRVLFFVTWHNRLGRSCQKILICFRLFFVLRPLPNQWGYKKKTNKQTKHYLATLVSESVRVVPPTATPTTETHLNPQKWDGEVELSSRCFSVHRKCDNEKGGSWFTPTCQQ